MRVVVKIRCLKKHDKKTRTVMHTNLKISLTSTRYEISKVLCWVIWLRDPINFLNSFFVDNCYLDLNISPSSIWSVPLKNDKIINKKDETTSKLLEIEGKNEKREWKTGKN